MTDEVRTAAELEAEARVINARPWEPPSGMVKKRCLRCRYFFAVSIAEAEVTATCPDCAPSQAPGCDCQLVDPAAGPDAAAV